MKKTALSRQLIRYGIIGMAHNAVGYGVYILLTWLGADPKLVVGICYPIAMAISFFGNKKITFTYTGGMFHSGIRFFIAHACSYAINLAMLWICSDLMGYPHQVIQLAAICVCAGFLFLSMKFFVFPDQVRS